MICETLNNDITSVDRTAIILEQLATYVALQPSGTNLPGPPLSILRQEASKARLNVIALVYVTVPGKRDHLGNFFKIELLLPQGRVGFELQNALHI